MTTSEIVKIIKSMPPNIYSNEYYKNNHYINNVSYCSWNYETKPKYCSDYQIKLFERDGSISIYLFRMDKVLPVKRGPKVIINSLQSIAAYFRIIGFKVETLYDRR